MPVEVEAEQRILDQALADHVVEGRHHSIHSNVGVTHAENPIKLDCLVGLPYREGLSEGLLLDVHPAEGDGVRGQEPGQTAGPVPNLEISPVLLNIFWSFLCSEYYFQYKSTL